MTLRASLVLVMKLTVLDAILCVGGRVWASEWAYLIFVGAACDVMFYVLWDPVCC